MVDDVSAFPQAATPAKVRKARAVNKSKRVEPNRTFVAALVACVVAAVDLYLTLRWGIKLP